MICVETTAKMSQTQKSGSPFPAWPRAILSAALSLLSAASSHAGVAADSKLATFQKFVNGEISIREATVYRKITERGKVINQGWWRFSWQKDGQTWYVQLLIPDKQEPSKLVPQEGNCVCGASLKEFWVVSDKDVHVAAKGQASGSCPDEYGSLYRNLMFSALSLGVPRRKDVLSVSEVRWEGVRFTTAVPTNFVLNRVTGSGAITGKLNVAPDGLPRSAEYPSLGNFMGGSVTYQHEQQSAIPVIFTVQDSKWAMRYEFLSLELGSNELQHADGFLPGDFAKAKLNRHFTYWTNDRPYSLTDRGFAPAFGLTPVGAPLRTTGTLIMLLLSVVSATFLALWYWRQRKKQ
ncbi:MAG TPA: hypothetical protein VG146_00610 [Verrucomicrobiae bacterium]|nr:hypothetical protein [Verrucomicrobiae bacterium]